MEALERRFGKLAFKDVLEPAAQYAEGGFPISGRIASDWVLPKALPLKGCCTDLDPDSIRVWYLTAGRRRRANGSRTPISPARCGCSKRMER